MLVSSHTYIHPAKEKHPSIWAGLLKWRRRELGSYEASILPHAHGEAKSHVHPDQDFVYNECFFQRGAEDKSKWMVWAPNSFRAPSPGKPWSRKWKRTGNSISHLGRYFFHRWCFIGRTEAIGTRESDFTYSVSSVWRRTGSRSHIHSVGLHKMNPINSGNCWRSVHLNWPSSYRPKE